MKDSSTSNSSQNEHGHVTVCDINKSMLEVGKDRAKKVYIYIFDIVYKKCLFLDHIILTNFL